MVPMQGPSLSVVAFVPVSAAWRLLVGHQPGTGCHRCTQQTAVAHRFIAVGLVFVSWFGLVLLIYFGLVCGTAR